MLAHTRQRFEKMQPSRKLLGEQFLQVAEQRTGLCVAFKALARGLTLTPMSEAFQGIQALGDCHAMLMCECGRRH
jgi:hypothetical protein